MSICKMLSCAMPIQPVVRIALTIIVLLSDFGSSQYQAQWQCTSRQCAQTRGYIDYSYIDLRTNTAWTITHPQGQFTTFVLHIKDVQAPQGLFAWLVMLENRYTFVKQHNVRATDDQVFIFDDTVSVSISVPRIKAMKFRLDFYVGCSIEEASDISFTKEPFQPQPTYNPYSSFYRPPPPSPQTCWFVIPRIQVHQLRPAAFQNYPYYNYFYRGPFEQRTRNVEVQQTYMTLKDVNVTSSSAINVTNVISGEEIMDAYEDEEFIAASLDKSSKTVIYNRNQLPYRVSIIILIALQCSSREDCGEATFQYRSYAFQQDDVDCIEEERKCLFNIGDADYNCTAKIPIPELALLNSTSKELRTTNCPAFNIISESIINAFPEFEDFDTPEEPDVIGPPAGYVSARRFLSVSSAALEDIQYKSRLPKTSKWKRKLRKCNKYSAYCSSRKCNIKRFRRRGCQKICYLVKHVLRLCSQQQYFS